MTNWSIKSCASLDGDIDPQLCVTYWYVEYSTFISAGHDTSAKSLAWYFYAIAKHPEAQARIREEIALVRARATGDEFTVADLNSMVYTLATLKVKFSLNFFWSLSSLRRSVGVDEA